jgi:hypothetical protein
MRPPLCPSCDEVPGKPLSTFRPADRRPLDARPCENLRCAHRWPAFPLTCRCGFAHKGGLGVVDAVVDVVVTRCVADGTVFARHERDTTGNRIVWGRGAACAPGLLAVFVPRFFRIFGVDECLEATAGRVTAGREEWTACWDEAADARAAADTGPEACPADLPRLPGREEPPVPLLRP